MCRCRDTSTVLWKVNVGCEPGSGRSGFAFHGQNGGGCITGTGQKATFPVVPGKVSAATTDIVFFENT